MNPNPPRGTQAGVGEGHKGGKNFSWRLGGRLGARRELSVLGPARRCAAARAHFLARRAPRPQLCTRRTRRPDTERRARRERGRERRGCGRRARPVPPSSASARAARVPSAAPGRFAGCRLQRPRWLEGAALAVARGRLNPLLALSGLRRGEQRWPRAPTDTSGARASRLPGPPLDVARPDPHPQQFTCWSLASG